MAVVVETLDKLERKITLSLPLDVIKSEVDERLRKLARTVKIDGFRAGKVPMHVVSQRYGHSVHYEVLNSKVGAAFANATNEAQLRVAGQPRIEESLNSPEGSVVFDAVFEVFPEVKIPDLSKVEIEKFQAQVTEEAIDKTLDILRKQRRTFSQRSQDAAAQDTDRVTVDFEGKIDGESFPGSKAQDYPFIVGEVQMLRQFEEAIRGMKSGESKTFELLFPADYHWEEIAGKTADFLVTLKKIEAARLPEVNDDLARLLGTPDATVAGLRNDIRKNLQREVSARLLNRNKSAVMDVLLKNAEFEIPQSSVQSEIARMIRNARAELKQRGVKDVDKVPMPEEVFVSQAQRKVRLGLVVAELVRSNALQAKPEQVKAYVDELASSYEKPADVTRWYYGDQNRMAEVEALVLEKNITDFVFARAKVSEKIISFDELMENS